MLRADDMAGRGVMRARHRFRYRPSPVVRRPVFAGTLTSRSRATTPGDRRIRAIRLAGDPSDPSLQAVYVENLKPHLDRVLATGLLVATGPVLATLALSIRLTLGSPVLYCQTRVGKDGKDFTVYKFRTMGPDRRMSGASAVTYAGPERRVTHKTMADPRHTRFGRWLRALSLDELPQLVNVIRGEMSLVGPRPEVSDVADAMGLRDHPRHRVRPGITGMWQVSPARGQLIIEGLDLDVRYLESCSLRTDVTILRQTVTTLLRRTGA